jgi:hypothetical protein
VLNGVEGIDNLVGAKGCGEIDARLLVNLTKAMGETSSSREPATMVVGEEVLVRMKHTWRYSAKSQQERCARFGDGIANSF